MDRQDKPSFWGGLLRRGSLMRRGLSRPVRQFLPPFSYGTGHETDYWGKESDGPQYQQQTRRFSQGQGGHTGGDEFGPRRRRTVSGGRGGGYEDGASLPRDSFATTTTATTTNAAAPNTPRRRVSEPVRETIQLTSKEARNSGVTSTPTKRTPTKTPATTTSDSIGEDEVPSVRKAHSLTPLTQWPPPGLMSHDELPQQDALELIARGAPSHKGRKMAIPHASDQYYALYATTSGNRGGHSDAANMHDSMIQLMTMRLQVQGGYATYPWETLERPSYTFFYGKHPGTITLNQWAAMASVVPPRIALRDSGVEPRDVGLEEIFERLRALQAGLEDDDLSQLYRSLYKRFLRDPDKLVSPHKTLDKQITDLIMVLSRPDWIDFTDPKNQVATRFIYNTGEENREQYRKFFHQLLLSLELDLRIHSQHHGDWAKEKLLNQIPPTIKWNLALARRWRENVRVESYGALPEDVRLRYKLKKRQVKQLRRFAQIMKWPNVRATVDNLKQRDEDFTLDSISSDAFAFFSGLVLPGSTFPFLIMNTLIDLDPDPATDDLALLSHMYPHCGFQYRNSHTYWSASCIVGKVLAPSCHSVAGWVGPGRPTADLGRSQIARIRTRRPKQRMNCEDVECMGERSDALGPSAEVYPVDEYALPLLDRDYSSVVDTVRIELLSFKPVVATKREGGMMGPRLFDAKIQFAIDGVSWPLRLMYDVAFVSAWPCSDGPHPLFYDYLYQLIKVDEIMKVRNWGKLYGERNTSVSNSAGSSPPPPPPPAVATPDLARAVVNGDGGGEAEGEGVDDEKVLVVDAVGVRDNEVLARAWCAHWGFSAVVADIRKTCISCAIREAYAATLTVVILVEDQANEDE